MRYALCSLRFFKEAVIKKFQASLGCFLLDRTTWSFERFLAYTSSLPIDYLVDNDILMAYKMNGLPLSPERGAPFQLVAESKWGYKWVKWITEIELSDDVGYEGYWESRGFSNSGDLD